MTDNEIYDPTDDADDTPTIMGFGDYREQSLDRLDATPHLDPIKSFDSIDEMVEAVGEIHVPGYSNPPENTMQRLRSVYEGLPSDEARRYYLTDDKLTRTVNAARRQFNEWVGRKKRYDQIPGWAEAGPANYPTGKHGKARDSERQGSDDLQEKLDRLKARVNGARQRALKKAGTSVAEQNEQVREADRAEGRETYEKGDIVLFFSTSSNWLPWGVKRVNKKSLTLSRPHEWAGQEVQFGDGVYPDYDTANAKLDTPRWLKGPLTDEQIVKAESLPNDRRDAQVHLFGEKWVRNHLPADTDTNDTIDTMNDKDDTTNHDTGDPSLLGITESDWMQGGVDPAVDVPEWDDETRRKDSEDPDADEVGMFAAFAEKDSRADEQPDHVDDSDDTPAVDPQTKFDTDDEQTDVETLAVEFASRAAANHARVDLPEGAETGQYDRRHKTVEVYVGALSDSQREQFEAAAMDASRGDVKYGQADLMDAEKRRLKKRDGWTWGTHGFHARSAKAILQHHGVEDWYSHYDHTIEPQEHLDVVPQKGKERDESQGSGVPRGGGSNYADTDDEDAPHVIERRGKQAAKSHSDECKNAEKWCDKGDEGACIHLVSDCGWTEQEIEELRADVEEMEVRMDALVTDDGGVIEEGEPAIEPETVELAGDTDELPPFALRTLQRSWNGYRAAALKAEEAKAAIEQYHQARVEVRQYGSIINEVRNRFGQEPMDIEATVTVKNDDGETEQRKVRLADLPELESVRWGMTGTTKPTAESEGTTLFAGWATLSDVADGGAYDPTVDAATDGGVAAAVSPSNRTDYQKALEHHRSRSRESQEIDEGIQAREQVTDFETWVQEPNMMDFIGVDDLKTAFPLGN